MSHNFQCLKGTDDKCCGACKYMCNEMFDGFGNCENGNQESIAVYCGDVCDLFEAEKAKEYMRNKINQ